MLKVELATACIPTLIQIEKERGLQRLRSFFMP